ncbi:ExeM/NucH family extracellular endonuclease [Agromyces archimandritae]|uniref:ExeM/NucH family extracellular endonuclease n=1 Tax=Agromyces archimandritae TaxID=2781962 RepID=A0A975FNA1_9MICO|nr:ExeM/NucH family extracellular endonuclease [Agromyces archimandritae]QTX05598.1 ExeM/NucH family extracellular endonuclease [Agromyces archimandritae]
MEQRSIRRSSVAAVIAAGALATGLLGAPPAFAAEPTHTIAEVQGTGDATPLAGQTVTVEGVVTADFRTGGYRGVYLQTAGSGGVDASRTASDGIFVFLGSRTLDADPGDLVRVTGTATEYNGLTQISLTSSEVVSSDAEQPVPTPLPEDVVGDARELLEGMLVEPAGEYRLASSHNLFSFGELWLDPGEELPVKSTEAFRPGPEADAVAAANRASRILLDDGWSIRVDNAAHPNDQPYFTEGTVVRNGDRVDFPDAPYVLSYGFDEWRLQPLLPVDSESDESLKPGFESLNPRTDAPEDVGGAVEVGAFNVYNYFTTFRDEDSNARGAANAAQFAIQQEKIGRAIHGLGADVVALQEIENSVKLGKPIDSALAALVAHLNETGDEEWAYVPTPAVLDDAAITDYITSAIIYRADRVAPVGDSLALVDETVWDIAREPIAQAFEGPDGEIFSVVANHFKSKGGDGDEPADGQGHFNAERVAQAESLLGFTDDVAEAAGSDRIFLIGDFNSYANEDPIQVFADAGWVDLVPERTDEFTYTFDGELGSLDHVIASPSAAEQVRGVDVWNINSPEWSDRGYAYGAADASNPFRSSDHDPILVGVGGPSGEPAGAVDIDVVTINDFHGRIEQSAPSAGAAVLAGAVESIRAANPNTIFAAAGDLIGASTFTSFIQHDEPTIEALNAAGLEVSAAGNHEFDQGWADLRDRVQGLADFDYISSNVFLDGTDETALAPYWTKTLDDVTVGFIGAVTEELPSLVSPAGIAELEVRDIVDSVNAAAADLTDGDDANGEADVLILLVHEGAATTAIDSALGDTPLGRIVSGVTPEVDAIVSAHTHLAYNHVIDGRPVVSAGQYGERFGVMRLSVDPGTKELLSISNEIKPLLDAGGAPLYQADQEVAGIVAEAKAVADVLGAEKVGDITADFNRALQPGTDQQGNPTLVENRGGESTIGNFVADVQLWAAEQTRDVDVAFMNPGGIRTDLKFAGSGEGDADGNVSYREAANVQPFANTLTVMELTGAQIVQVLEEQWQPAEASRPFLKLGVSEGLEVVYDPAAAAGSHITSVRLNGEPLDASRSYSVVVNSFLAAGGDNFGTFAEGANRADSGLVDLQSMVDWFDAHADAPASPDLRQRSVGIAVSEAPAGGFRPGDPITVDLSSLDFSTTELHADSVSVTIGGVEIGSAEVDSELVPASDEVGRATVTGVIPPALAGEQLLEVQVAPTGSRAALPITLAPADPAAPTISIDVDSVKPGEPITISGAGFAPGTEVGVELHSTPVALGTATAAADGTLSLTATVPLDVAAGTHTVYAFVDGIAVASATLVVEALAPVDPTDPAGPAGPGTAGTGSGAGLASTGVELGWAAFVALLALGFGTAFAARRRPARR